MVLDVYSRGVVGWAIDSSQTAALVTNALGMAIDSRKPAGGTVIHSDILGCPQFETLVQKPTCQWLQPRRHGEVPDPVRPLPDRYGDGQLFTERDYNVDLADAINRDAALQRDDTCTSSWISCPKQCNGTWSRTSPG